MITDPPDAAFRAYLEARDAVQRLKQAEAPSGLARPSGYWAEELEQVDYMADASPLIIRKLRHHAFNITGVRPYDYREKGGGRRQIFEARLRALSALDDVGLQVPESTALGGFGYDIDGRLFNVDTLKFYEVLIGMQRSGVLPALRAIGRPLVCEIGAGWGGFAYQFKKLFPRSTYVIVDFPELFLFSATYLKAVFPEARVRFVGAESATPVDDIHDVDFVFVPTTRAALVASMPLDLTVNMASFQEMTEAQVRAYVGLVAEARCPLLYSLNRERSPYNSELTSVSDVLGERYRLTDVPLLDSDYPTAVKRPSKPGKVGERSLFYQHRVGRLAGTPATARGVSNAVTSRPAGPRTVFGMTLYNNGRHLREALDSLRAQSCADFMLVLLDDASSDETEHIVREYAARDPRIRYFRHSKRRAMIATWHEVVLLAARECPSAIYFAWVSDHDRWHSQWLEAMAEALDRDRGAVLAYPITRRISDDTGDELEKGPRLFDTAGLDDARARWTHFCRYGVGSGDMVYGLMRLDALKRAGIFRTVLRPDRLLVAELTLLGRITQVPEVLWFRRQSAAASVARQRYTLVLAEESPRWFAAPPWLQHALVLWREYVRRDPRPVPLSTGQWMRMLTQYLSSYAWRHLRKSETSHAVGRGIDNAIWVKKITRHHYHHAVYHALIGLRLMFGKLRRQVRWGVYRILTARRAMFGKLRRLVRRVMYRVLVFMHRVGLRRGGEGTPVP